MLELQIFRSRVRSQESAFSLRNEPVFGKEEDGPKIYSAMFIDLKTNKFPKDHEISALLFNIYQVLALCKVIFIFLCIFPSLL